MRATNRYGRSPCTPASRWAAILCLLACLFLPGTQPAAGTAGTAQLRLGDLVRGELSSSEPFVRAGGFLFEPGTDETVTIDAHSLEFDTLLTISRLQSDGSSLVMYQDDDDGAGTNSRIVFQARRGETYRIDVESGERAVCGRRFGIAATAGASPIVDFRAREVADEGYWNEVDAALPAGSAMIEPALAESGPTDPGLAGSDLTNPGLACRLRAMAGRARTLGFWGHYDRARALAGEAVTAAERWFGERDVLVARALHELATIEADMGEYDDARAHAERSLAIRTERLGGDHPLLAATLRVLGPLAEEAGEPKEEVALLERAAAITETGLGPDHPETIASVSKLGLTLGAGYIDLARGRRLMERALMARRQRLDSDDLALAETLRDMAVLDYKESAFEEAAPLAEEAAAIAERRFGPEHPLVAWYLGVLGTALECVGQFERATPVYAQVLSIYQENFPDDHPFMALAYGLVAGHQYLRGAYAEARPLAQIALRLAENTFGPRNPALFHPITLVARLDMAIGAYADAEPLLDRCLEITRQADDGHNMPHALTLGFTGELRRATGDIAAAEDAYRQALQISSRLLGRDHHIPARLMSELAEVRHDRGDYAEAMALFEESLKVQTDHLGETHPIVARSAAHLAEALSHTGDAARSYALASLSLEVAEQQLSAGHPWIADNLQLLARLDAAAGRREIAVDEALRAAAIGREQLDSIVESLSERRALGYASLLSSSLDLGLSLAVEIPGDPATTRRVWDAVVRSRALTLDEMAARHRLANAVADPRTTELRSALTSARSRLAHLVLRDPGNMPVAGYRLLIDTTRREKEALEEQLAQRVPSSLREIEADRIGIAQVAAALPPGGALIAYVSYDRYPRSTDSQGPTWLDEGVPSYLAFVLQAGRSEIEVIPIGSKRDIDALVEAWRSEVSREPSTLRAVRRRDEETYRSAAARLRAAVWDPAARHLSGVSRVIVVPDGSLNLVNLSTLPDRDGRFLLEDGPTIHYVSAERDLVARPGSDPVGKGILLVGDPDFDWLPQPQVTERLASLAPDSGRTVLYRSPTPDCEAFRRTHFDALPGAAEEVREIDALLRPGDEPLVLTGAQAAEPAFKMLTPGRRIIHVATHGFFIDEECRADDRYLGGTPAAEASLLASGLALAGANRCDEVAADSGVDDGILTAEEIASLDLRGVEWVVLSACETGIGETLPGEGVLGLRRAFSIAGAGTVIMSLWKIKDEAAREWMSGLYRARLDNATTPEAMRSASLAMLQAARSAGRTTHPFYWGPFVAAGNSD